MHNMLILGNEKLGNDENVVQKYWEMQSSIIDIKGRKQNYLEKWTFHYIQKFVQF